jgi:hypothetical protein
MLRWTINELKECGTKKLRLKHLKTLDDVLKGIHQVCWETTGNTPNFDTIKLGYLLILIPHENIRIRRAKKL